MQLSAHPIAAATGALPPGALPATSAPSAGSETPFAKLLSAQPQPHEPHEPPKADAAEAGDKPAPAADHHKAAKAPQHTGAATARPVKAAAGTPAGRSGATPGGALPRTPRDDAEPKDPPQTALTADPAAAVESAVAEPAKAASTDPAAPTALDPALAQWLASLNRPAPPATPPAGGSPVAADACVTTVDAGASKGTVRPTPPAADAEARAAKAEDRKPVGIEPVDAKAAGEHAAVIAAADERPATNKPAERSAAADGVSALAPAAGVHAPARAEAPAAAQPVNLPTPVHSPEFKAALGMQVSLLARDGVQHAELHLNPAEMGPISVQIALDGSRAQVDFGAESAHTRHLIETGLPELAAALRDAGLTLAGGGVSQHARGGQPQGDAAPRERDDAAPRGVDPADAGPATARRVNLRLPQGAVDLYA